MVIALFHDAGYIRRLGDSARNGAEFEGQLRILDNLSASFAVGYLHSDFEEFLRKQRSAPLAEGVAGPA